MPSKVEICLQRVPSQLLVISGWTGLDWQVPNDEDIGGKYWGITTMLSPCFHGRHCLTCVSSNFLDLPSWMKTAFKHFPDRNVTVLV